MVRHPSLPVIGWLGWELGICKIFNTVSILAESRRIIPTEPVIEAARPAISVLKEGPGGPQPIGLLLDEL
jgi:hypothetical protein